MRILFLNPAGEIGGAERLLLDGLAELRRQRPAWELSVIASAEGSLSRQARLCGIPVPVAPFPRALDRLGDAGAGGPAGRLVSVPALAARTAMAAPRAAGYAMELRRLIRHWRPDIVHTNGNKMHVLGALACPRPIPLVWHLHEFLERRRLMRRLLRWQTRRCAAAIAVSAEVARDAGRALGGRISVYRIPNGIDLEKFSPVGPVADLDGLSGLEPCGPDVVRVGLVATMARWKGQEIFLRAVAQLPPDLPVRAYVIGGGIYSTAGSQYAPGELRRLARQLGLETRAGFTGEVGETGRALRALDIVVHASTAPEPFGLVIAEAMACGRAVIFARGAGAAGQIEIGRDAWQHEPGNCGQLAEAIAALARNSERRADLGRRAWRAALSRFDRRRMVAEWIGLYESLAAPRLQNSTAELPVGAGQ